MEVGAAIDNSFYLIRINAVWRLKYLDNPGISGLGIKGSIELRF